MSFEKDSVAPLRECGIVMKGGISSGVVYPLAAVELSKTFRFRQIGGTSAGAIAAAATAAAEYGRLHGQHGRFQELAELPDWLGNSSSIPGRSNLFALFQPQQETAAVFDVFSTLQSNAGRQREVQLAAVAFVLVRNKLLAALIGVLPGAFVFISLLSTFPTALSLGFLTSTFASLGILTSLIIMGLGAIVGSGYSTIKQTLDSMPNTSMASAQDTLHPSKNDILALRQLSR